MSKKVLVSVSGGKDSTATLLMAIERVHKKDIFAAFADTGNEHPATYEHLRYLERETGVKIKWLRADFTEMWDRRIDYVRDFWPGKGVPPDIVKRVLKYMKKGATGNPFLDLCIIKGRFPSRMAQFCTQFLKKFPLQDYILDLIQKYRNVESWQGVRRDESAARANLAECDVSAEGIPIVRPIIEWNVERVFKKIAEHGLKPNPLYKQGMNRVGCMPCINTSKGELREIAARFPEHIDRIEEWEAIVSATAKRQESTFFPSPLRDGGIQKVRARVEWAKTVRGGQQYDLLSTAGEDEPDQCASAYGLCE